jgi:hypothetical protein
VLLVQCSRVARQCDRLYNVGDCSVSSADVVL